MSTVIPNVVFGLALLGAVIGLIASGGSALLLSKAAQAQSTTFVGHIVPKLIIGFTVYGAFAGAVAGGYVAGVVSESMTNGGVAGLALAFVMAVLIGNLHGAMNAVSKPTSFTVIFVGWLAWFTLPSVFISGLISS